MNTYHIAQVNIGKLRAPVDDPLMEDFVANLDHINALAESTPGFVWRLVGENNAPSSTSQELMIFDDPMIAINMSVWESIDALYQYTYYSNHVAFFRRRTEWFEKMDKPYMAMWWVPAGHRPTPQEAKEKLAILDQHGPTPLAFTFKKPFTIEEMLAVVG